MTRLRAPALAASELDIRAEHGIDPFDDPDVAALLAAWDGRAVVVDAGNLEAVRRGLCALSNHCDDLSREPGVSADERVANRHASTGLAGMMLRLSRECNRQGVAGPDPIR